MKVERIEDYVDLAVEQRWRARQSRNGYILYSPDGKTIVTLRPSDDWRTQANWRSQLRRGGLKFPEDEQRKSKPHQEPIPLATERTLSLTPPDALPPPPAGLPLEAMSIEALHIAAQQRIETITGASADLEQILAALRKKGLKVEQLQALLKGL